MKRSSFLNCNLSNLFLIPIDWSPISWKLAFVVFIAILKTSYLEISGTSYRSNGRLLREIQRSLGLAEFPLLLICYLAPKFDSEANVWFALVQVDQCVQQGPLAWVRFLALLTSNSATSGLKV